MTFAAMLIAIATYGASGADVSGHVVDMQGTPVSSARVFIEPGLGSALRETHTLGDGAFGFRNVPPGVTGVFAIAPGLSFGGESMNIALADSIEGLRIRLAPVGTVSGRVVGPKGKPISGARVTRAALLGPKKVGIPFAKLRAMGIKEPSTDASGAFVVPYLPRGGRVALKIGHPAYAQEGLTDIAVGERSAKVTMNPGVLLSGSVYSRGSSIPVGNATILVRNTAPPFDTSLTRTGAQGAYALRLRPGEYLYQAAGPTYRTPGWERILVSGLSLTQNVNLFVAGTGAVAGKVMDARTGKPIAGARMVLEVFGLPVEIRNTGPTGQFSFTAAEGENVVRLDGVPGYLEPAHGAMSIEVKEGEVTELPSFWLAPIPAYSLLVIDQQEKPVQGALVKIVRPAQFGWYETGEDGHVSLAFARMPGDGKVIGLVEDRSLQQGALFALDRQRGADAIVKMLPLSTVTGRVVSDKGRGLEGIAIDGRFQEESMTGPVFLWRSVSGAEGRFEWPGIIPHVPQYCTAYNPDGQDVQTGMNRSSAFILSDSPLKNIGRITVQIDKPGKSVLGKKLNWQGLSQLCGDTLEAKSLRSTPAVLFYCPPEEAEMVIGAVSHAGGILADRDLLFAVVVDGKIECDSADIPVYRGSSPNVARTFVTDSSGKVVLETFGMPPMFAINKVAPATR